MSAQHGRIQRGGTGGPDPPPPEKSQKYRVLSKTGLDPLKITKLPRWAIIGTPMAFRWRADDGPIKAVFGSSIPPSTNKKKKKKKKIGPPLTKLSGSAHAMLMFY